MSTPQGIFDTTAKRTARGAAPPASPFAAPQETPASGGVPVQAGVESPFWIAGDFVPRKTQRLLLPAACRESDAPFCIPEPQGFGFEATTQPAPSDQPPSDSVPIKQLELRAIFGVDHEMANEEILRRCRSLPGIRHLAPVGENDIAAVDALKQVIAGLGFGGALKLHTGIAPIEFIREGRTLLAVQTDGGFAPGVRETLMIVARELSR